MLIFAFLVATVLGPPLSAPQPVDNLSSDSLSAHYRVYAADGRPASFEEVVDAMGRADVAFIGERHDDPVAHTLQRRLLEAAHLRYGESRPVALSLEMFTRDAQLVLDEYLAGLITEEQFLKAAQPWQNYATDYRPLVEYARGAGLAVLAANTPRRYVNRVARLGPAALAALPDDARAFLPPLDFAPASAAYTAKWNRLMLEAMGGGHGDASGDEEGSGDANQVDGDGGADAQQKDAGAQAASSPSAPNAAHDVAHDAMANMLAAQSLWDATMAHSIALHLMAAPEALVLHMVGAFHVEQGTGIPEHLARYRPGTRALVITVQPEADFETFDDARHAGLGDFVILSDEGLPRTYDANP